MPRARDETARPTAEVDVVDTAASARASTAPRRPLLEELSGGTRDLLGRHVADPLRESPAMTERVGDLAVPLAPERVAQRLPHHRAGFDRALPQTVHVRGHEMEHRRGAADGERG